MQVWRAASVNAQDLFTAGQLKLFARKINGRLDLAADTKELTVIQPDNPAHHRFKCRTRRPNQRLTPHATAPGRTNPRNKRA